MAILSWTGCCIRRRSATRSAMDCGSGAVGIGTLIGFCRLSLIRDAIESVS
jgi:hypothetical protein